jgi:hypothetical protein
VSIYQQTQRSYPDSQQGPIRFKNLLGEAEAALRDKYPVRRVQEVMDRLLTLQRDPLFWTHRTDALAVFAAPNTFETFGLQRTVAERVVVADTFHLKPLMRALQTTDRFQLLCLTRSHFRVSVGTRDALDEYPLPGAPTTIDQALSQRVPKLNEGVPDAQPGVVGFHPPVQAAPPSNHVSKGEQARTEAELFFRVVDQIVWERCSRPSGLPLVLAALPEHQALFRGLTSNPRLLPEGIEKNPDTLSSDQLRSAVWKILEPRFLEQVSRLGDDFRVAKSRQKGSDDLGTVAEAVWIGRVGTLLVEADREVPGSFDRTTGKVHLRNGRPVTAGDVLDDLAEVVLQRDGNVVIVPREQMPSPTGLAAIYRY